MRSAGSIDAFVEKMRRLVELERRAEVEETSRLQKTLSPSELQARGVTLLRLQVAEELTGLGGRTLVGLETASGGDLPAHRFQPGDIVQLSRSREARAEADSRTGVVYRLRGRRIVIVLDEGSEADDGDSLEGNFRLDRVANDVTYRRLREALDGLQGCERGRAARLRDVAFGLREPAFDVLKPPGQILQPLDGSQQDAVAFALAARDIALIHGPPGTGKTTTTAELVLQSIRRGERVLACAPSNIAADNLTERLAALGARVVRLGHPARLLPSVLEHSLDSLVEQAEGTRIAADVRREIELTHRRLRRAGGAAERWAMREQLRRLRREVRQVEDRTVRDVLSSAEVVLATNTGAGDGSLDGLDFDLVVIDEAAQALEVSSWIPLLRGRRAVLVGDHRQLPPTVISREAAQAGLDVTLFDRLEQRLGEPAARMLTVQYRMHERIMEWPSREMYGGRLQAHASVAQHLLEGLPGVAPGPDTSIPLVFIDTAGCDLAESAAPEGDSKANDGEVRVVARHVEALVGAGVRARDAAVIAPYNAQVDRLRVALAPSYPDLEIGSVDGFQGREKEAVVISFVRSNPRGEIGFLADDRRTNVAITRARRHLALVGDSATISRHAFLGRLVEFVQANGEYRSAWEYRG